jgi:uncharacterized protein YktA (UPF0223 family)
MNSYSYPIDYSLFDSEEVILLVEFFSLIEDANESSVNKQELIKKYKEYREIINSQSMEKQIERDFKKVSGYSIYQTIKKYKDQ